MHGRIHVTEGPLISGNLAIRMHIPLTQHEDQLFLGTVRINQRQCNAMERKVPGGVSGILPLVRHADYVGVIEMDPCFVAPTGSISGRRRLLAASRKPTPHFLFTSLLLPAI